MFHQKTYWFHQIFWLQVQLSFMPCGQACNATLLLLYWNFKHHRFYGRTLYFLTLRQGLSPKFTILLWESPKRNRQISPKFQETVMNSCPPCFLSAWRAWRASWKATRKYSIRNGVAVQPNSLQDKLGFRCNSLLCRADRLVMQRCCSCTETLNTIGSMAEPYTSWP